MTPAQCKAARALLNWTQLDLVEQSGVSHRVVRGFETGSQGVAEKSVNKIRAAFESAGLSLLTARGMEGVARVE